MRRTIDVERVSRGGLCALVVVQAVMAAALFSRTPPHPPLAVPLFGMAPFLAASLAVAAAALCLQGAGGRLGAGLALLAGLLGLISFGPQKWLDPALPEIWPAVLVGQVAALAVLVAALLRLRRPLASAE